LNGVEAVPLRTVEVRSLQLGLAGGRFRLYREQFFQGGARQWLLFITNVDTLLRSEELRVWQNLIRVLSHEINNSLTPLAALSDALQRQVRKRESDAELAQELEEGLAIIKGRTRSLSAFLGRYRQLTN